VSWGFGSICDGEQVYDLDVFEELGTVIDTLDIPLDGAALAAVVGLRDRLDARISDAVAAHDRAGSWELDGDTSMTAWLADRAAMPRPRAAAIVSRARKLAHLPVTAGAWRDGVLSNGQVEAIAVNLDADTVALFADHESAMVPTLVELSVRDVVAAMQRWRECATADRDPSPNPPRRCICPGPSAGAGGGRRPGSRNRRTPAHHPAPRPDPRRRRRTRS
jgi:hypothetical protein